MKSKGKCESQAMGMPNELWMKAKRGSAEFCLSFREFLGIGIGRGLSSAASLFPDRNHEPIWIYILGNSRSKHFRWLLQTRHISFQHFLVELVEIRDTQTRATPAGRGCFERWCFGVQALARMKRQRGALGRKLTPAWGFESQREPNHIAIKGERALHVAHENNGVI